jgi:N-acetylmuramoyl-L-alanine amidase CwlA
MNIIQRLIPDNKKPKYNVKGKEVTFVMVPEYITIHETDNKRKGATAEAHARLQAGGNSRKASWHYQVDDKQTIQSLPTNEAGIHAGDGENGTGNRKSVAIEICVNEDGDYEKALKNAAQLVAFLMKELKIPIHKVVPHQHWSGKNCPRNLLSRWTEFITLCKIEAAKLEKPKKEKLATIKTGSMPIEDAEKIAAELKKKYGWKIVHVMEV